MDYYQVGARSVIVMNTHICVKGGQNEPRILSSGGGLVFLTSGKALRLEKAGKPDLVQ